MSANTFLIEVPFALTQEPKATPEAPTTGTTGGPTPGPQTPAGQGGPGSCADPQMLMMMGLFVALMYFMVLRPENKRRKETAAMLASIKVGDKVVTTGGMHGVIHKLDETTVTLTVDAVKMTFDRAAIARVDRGDAGASAGTQAKAK
jgi:preprotein translocase YajC subunit